MKICGNHQKSDERSREAKKQKRKVVNMYKWFEVPDVWRMMGECGLTPTPYLEERLRQTKSLTSSAAGECLCGRFSLAELTKQAMLPLLLGVELKSDGVEPPNRRDAERPRCLFPASMLAVFICCSWPYSFRISSWKSIHDKFKIGCPFFGRGGGRGCQSVEA